MWQEGIEERADALVCCPGGSFGSFAQEPLECGKDLRDRVQVRQVWRQEQKLCAGSTAGSTDRLAGSLAFMAIATFGPPEIMDTDQGAQFTSFAWTARLRRSGVRISMDGTGRFRDSIFVERLWRSLKYEYVYLHT